tara:strand:+ start:2726 stop:2896 length:171 start_codon:yes stop_codon:yes gene_type:complete
MKLDAIKGINGYASNVMLAQTGSCKTLAYLILIFELMEFDLNNYAKDPQFLRILRE